ncbi:YbdD/YjiX family protein [Georgenia sp. TF02-10]|uniref:YbdD/YjiX family protein n=1 Tax=Georgenia sp. TF02-10 TaxID=2917725 RepID=UPI001FA6E95D|nr:YbdD/YjiX family protein [Georgenia sp. TF02-10]UNX56244.1 YbdD/YjiX family protein [Georgenia sp. TF02-10]
MRRPAALADRGRRAWRSLRWFARELSGESAYDKYLAHHAREHPGEAPLTARQFWRQRADEQERTPQARCC